MAAPTIMEQADFLYWLLKSGRMADGSEPAERWVRLTKEQTEMLLGIQKRLERMAPHEAKIKRLVTGT